MPWDASRLRVAPLVPGRRATRWSGPRSPWPVARGSRWASPGGRPTASLFFVDDRSGWWLPYRVSATAVTGAGPPPADAVPLVGAEAEFHAPDWVFGQHTFDELADGSLVARRSSEGRDTLVVLRPPAGGARRHGLGRRPRSRSPA